LCPHACNSSIPEPGKRRLHLSAVTGGQDLVADRDLGPVVPAGRMEAGQVAGSVIMRCSTRPPRSWPTAWNLLKLSAFRLAAVAVAAQVRQHEGELLRQLLSGTAPGDVRRGVAVRQRRPFTVGQRPAASYSAGRLDVVDRGARRGHEALPGAGEQGRVGKGAGPACIAGLDGAVPARVGRIAVALRARPAPRGRRLSTARDKMSFATGFDGSKCFGRRANDPGAMGVRMTIPGRRPRGAALAGLGLFRPDRTGARALLPERAAGIAVLSRT